MDGHVMGQAHNNHGTRAQDEHMHHVKQYTHNDTCNIKNENVKMLTFPSLVLEATSLIMSELPPASPKTHL